MNRPQAIPPMPSALRSVLTQRLQPLQTWWQARQERERRALRWGAFALLPVLVVFGYWLPVRERIEKLESKVVEARAQAAQMRGMRETWRGEAPARAARAAPALDLAPRLEAELRSALPGFNGSARAADNGVELLIEAVSFDALLPWLAQLARRDGLFAYDVQLQPVAGAGGGPGLVGGRIRLRGAES